MGGNGQLRHFRPEPSQLYRVSRRVNHTLEQMTGGLVSGRLFKDSCSAASLTTTRGHSIHIPPHPPLQKCFLKRDSGVDSPLRTRKRVHGRLSLESPHPKLPDHDPRLLHGPSPRSNGASSLPHLAGLDHECCDILREISGHGKQETEDYTERVSFNIPIKTTAKV